MTEIYNPLATKNLAKSVTQEFLSQHPARLPPDHVFPGAGVYALYYSGDFALYAPIVGRRLEGKYEIPIYVGKAVPKGSRKGGGFDSDQTGTPLYSRLKQHSRSIELATNLKIEHFSYRKLVVDDVWIPLGESLLIDRFKPVWNLVVEGFGNNTPGEMRKNGARPPWDVVHPGRGWSREMKGGTSLESIQERLQRHYAKHSEVYGG